MDARSLISGSLAAIALIGGIVLAALHSDATQVAALWGIASTFGGYVIGLNSEPQDSSNE